MITTEDRKEEAVNGGTAEAYSLGSLIQSLDEAMECEEVRDQVEAVKAAVEEASRNPDFLSARYRRPSQEQYARRSLYIDPSGRFSVLIMVWDKGQGTPLHDHGGTWVVECLLEGRMQVTNYDYVGEGLGIHRFQAQPTQDAFPGDADFRIPPSEHHVLSNPYDKPSITIHVFGGILSRINIFEPVEGGYRKTAKVMASTPL